MAGKELDLVYHEVEDAVAEAIKVARKGGGWIMTATDAWKRRVAAGGAPLMNVQLLLPTGGSFFLEVVKVAGYLKKQTGSWPSTLL